MVPCRGGVSEGLKRLITEDSARTNRDTQISAILDTFEKAKQPITKHYIKPGVVPVSVLPIVPDTDVCPRIIIVAAFWGKWLAGCPLRLLD